MWDLFRIFKRKYLNIGEHVYKPYDADSVFYNNHI